MMRGGVWVRAGRGFSLIEILGVLAIMGILAGMLAPSVIRQIRQSQATGEDARLRQVGEAILASIQATETIPNPNVAADDTAGWFSLARAYSSMPEDAFRYVYANNPSSERRYFLDPTLDAYLAGLSTPYQTPPDGFPVTGFPAGALRVLLVSSSRGTLNPPAPDDVVLPFAFRANLSGADQDELRNWNKIFTGGVATVPPLPNTPFGANWTGLGEFLHVQTIDLRPLFCRVELIDTACPPTAEIQNGVGYAINDTIVLNFAGAGCQFSFTALSAGAFTTTGIVDDPSIAGNIGASTPLMLTKPFAAIVINDPGPPAPRGVRISDNPPALAGNGAQATLAPALPPQFQINQLAAQAFGGNNTKVFYVLKGTSLSLLDDDGDTLITLTVQGDSIFKYFNSTWSRVD
jgi:prepilin-type N-terminal cleavage/methylation domain-containing protein